MNSTLMIVIGAVAGWWFEKRASTRRDPEATKQLGVLLASGLIVGESLLGVILAAIVVFSGNGAPLALVGDSFATAGQVLGLLAFAGIGIGLYRWLLKKQP